MVSFDVKSLFTSVPTKEAVAAVQETLTSDPTLSTRTDLSVESITALLHLCLATNFQFRGTHYELSNGLAMGSPSSPVVANIYMGKLEQTAIDSFGIKPKYWGRYVDDIFTIIKRAHVADLLAHLNRQHPSITRKG